MKNSPASAEDPGSIPGSGRSAGEGNGNPLQSQTEEPSGLQGLKRVGHDLATKLTPDSFITIKEVEIIRNYYT